MKILLVDDQPPVRELLRLYLESNTDSHIFEANSADQAIKLMKNVTDFDAIICDYFMPGGNGDRVYSHHLQSRSKTPFILCSSCPGSDIALFKNHPPFFEITKSKLLEGMEKLTRVFRLPTVPGGQIRIKTQTLMYLGRAPVDLYSEINDEKQIKVVHAGDAFDQIDVDRFKTKGIKYLFAMRNDFQKVIQKILSQLQTQAQSETLDLCRTLGMTTETIHLISELNDKLGMTPEVQTLVLQCLSQTVQALEIQPELSAYSRHLKLTSDDYLAQHSQLMAYLAGHLFSLLYGASERTLKTLALASLLHDLPLNSDLLAQYDSLEELQKAQPNLSSEDKNRFEQHALQASLLCDYFGVDPDLDLGLAKELIAHHHILAKPRPVTEECAVFQLAQLWLKHWHKNGKESTWNEFTQSLPTPIQQTEPYQSLISKISLSILARTSL